MTITVASALRVATCLACLVALPSVALRVLADETRPTVFRFDATEERSVIVEFNAPSLLEARKSGQARTTAAAATIDDLAARLAADIDAIEGRERASVQSATSQRTVLRHQYRMTLAGASVRVTRGAVAKIRKLSYVRAVHEDVVLKATLQSSVPHIRVPEVRTKYGRRGRGIVVAIIDSGINYFHWALGKGFGPGFKVIGGYDFANDDADPMDDHGHGTHVAGIVAGDVAPVAGVAPSATLLAYKVLDAQGAGSLSQVIAGVERTVDPNGDGDPSDHADIANMSLGGPRGQDDPLVRAVDSASAAGVIFCVAAGNQFVEAIIGTPGAAPSAITVGATDSQDLAAEFTSRGPVGGEPWPLKPEVAAPGVDILSSYRDSTRLASGTSMATPHVAGVVALLLEEHPSWTLDDVKAALITTAKPVFKKDTGAFDGISAGGGRIDALAAIEATVFPKPAALSFGFVATRGQPHTATAKMTLTNRGSSAETFTAVAVQLPATAKLTMSPESVTIGAGASAEVTFRLELSDTATPKFEEAPLTMTGMIQFTGTRSAFHVPWSIVTGDIIYATYGGTDDYSMYISQGSIPAIAWPSGPRTWGAFVHKTLAADVMVVSQPAADGPPRVIIREANMVEGFMPLTIQPEEATLQLAVSGVDEHGSPLDSAGSDFHAVWHEFTLPSLSAVRLIYTGAARSIHINPLKTTSIRTYETQFNGTSRYFGTYPFIRRGLPASQTLTIAQRDWATQKIQHHCKTACLAAVGAGVHESSQWDYFVLPPGAGTWDLHITPPTTTLEADFRAHLLVREEGYKVNVGYPFTFLSPPMRNENGRVVAAIFGRPESGDYASPDRETTMAFGDGPVVLRMTIGRATLTLDPYGPLGETMGENSFDVEATRTKLDGGSARMRLIQPAYYVLEVIPGVYQIAATGQYKIGERAGKVTLTARHDTRVHYSAPSLSLFRVEGSRGVVSWTVPAQSQPRLVFAGRVAKYDNAGINVEYDVVNASATRAWWRRHGTSEWLPLAVSITGEDNTWATREPGSPGTLFAASLAAAAQQEGEIDLKFAFEDTRGGTNETVYEPAFVVSTPVVRRRSMR